MTEPGVLERLFHIQGTRVVVTGAASGLGRAFSEVLAECGARVTLVDRDGDGLAAVAARLAEAGHEVHPVVADVADEAAVERFFDAAVEATGGADVVFANAGVAGGRGYGWSDGGQLLNLDVELWDRVLRINLTGVILTMRAAARRMIPQRSGRIIVTASVAGLRPDPMVGYPYTATKAAVVNLVRHAALELAQHQVTVMGIAPGPFRTNIGGGQPHDDSAVKAWATTVPLGRMASPDELKGRAVLLASPSASFMTGAIFPVDGGSAIAVPAM